MRASFATSEHTSFKIAALNATAGVLGDPGGVDTSFDAGALVIGEWSWSGDTSVSIGAWAYTDKQDDIRAVDGFGDPLRRRAQGGYVTLERGLWGDESSLRAGTGFLRAGVSDGDTTPFAGGWQAGLLVERVFSGRPDSVLSVGIHRGFLNHKHRRNQADLAMPAEHAESALEITYSDRIGWLTVQPDLQFIHDPGADPTRDNALVGALRLSVGL